MAFFWQNVRDKIPASNNSAEIIRQAYCLILLFSWTWEVTFITLCFSFFIYKIRGLDRESFKVSSSSKVLRFYFYSKTPVLIYMETKQMTKIFPHSSNKSVFIHKYM